MANINERGTYEFPGLFTGGQNIVTLPTAEAITGQGIPVRKSSITSQTLYKVDRPREDVVFNCLVTAPGRDGKEVAAVAQMISDGTMFITDAADAGTMKTSLRAMISIDGSFGDNGIPAGSRICDPKYPNLGEWLVVSPTEAVSLDRELFRDIPLLGRDGDVLAEARAQMYGILQEQLDKGELEYMYDRAREALSDDELYVDGQEKESVLNDFNTGREFAEEIGRSGGTGSLAGMAKGTAVEFGNEFASHAGKLLSLVRGIGAKVKDFFSKGEPISADDIMAKGVGEETAHAIHDEAELRQESRFSLARYADIARGKMKDLRERGMYALAGIAKSMSELKIDHYERMQAKEEKHIEAALGRIRARSEREGNVKAAEQRVKALISNIGRSIGNASIAIANTARFVASGNLAKAVSGRETDFDPVPYRPMIEGKDVQVTRSALNTAMYRHDDSRLIDSALHLAQIKAKLFHEHISAVPMAEREATADRLIGQMAESIGRSAMADRRIEYVTLEGFPSLQVGHTMELTKDGLVIDGENMTKNGYKGISRKMSPNAMMHLFVQAEKEAIVAKIAEAERVAPEIVQGLNNDNVRMSYNIGNALERDGDFAGAMSEVHKEMHGADGLMRGGYTFADKLQEKDEKEIREFLEKAEWQDVSPEYGGNLQAARRGSMMMVRMLDERDGSHVCSRCGSLTAESLAESIAEVVSSRAGREDVARAFSGCMEKDCVTPEAYCLITGADRAGEVPAKAMTVNGAIRAAEGLYGRIALMEAARGWAEAQDRGIEVTGEGIWDRQACETVYEKDGVSVMTQGSDVILAYGGAEISVMGSEDATESRIAAFADEHCAKLDRDDVLEAYLASHPGEREIPEEALDEDVGEDYEEAIG